MENKFMPLDCYAILVTDPFVQLLVERELIQIQNCPAATANEMAVRSGVTVKPLLPFDHTDALDGACLLEKN